MKKLIFPIVLVAALVLGAKDGQAANPNNNSKTQVEPGNKQVTTTKYNFTLFSFFTDNTKIKTDTTSNKGKGKSYQAIKED